MGSTTIVRLEKEGCEPYITSFSKNEKANVGAIIGGFIAWVPFLWAMKYKPTHTYELSPILDNQPTISTRPKADRLRELKQLLDEEIITQEEYEKEKKKILEE